MENRNSLFWVYQPLIMKNVLIDFLSYARGSMAISKPGKWREEGKKGRGKFVPLDPFVLFSYCVFMA